ncbi:MAG: hypothetical protein HY702_01710 [Gemmatimonadetes bacterium]|nr:hypothetical protein [Gemmatimonadota bacterium]
MSPPETLAPERPAPALPARPAEPQRPGAVWRLGVAERERRWRRAVALGVVGAVLLHLLVLRASPLFIRFAEWVEGIPYAAPPPPPAEGIRVLVLRELRERDAAPPRVEERRPEPVAETERSPSPAAAEPARAPRAAELLRPRVGDWRLIVPPPLPLRARSLTPAERTALLNERLHDRLAAANDSAAAAARREAAALDWTVGEEGNRWGVSPGRIHLGELTLPLPFGLGADPATAREQAERAQQYDEILRQAGQAGIDETFEDRVKAIRQRREAERKKKDEKTPADTTQKKPS